MPNKKMLLLVLLTSVFISGCIFDKDETGKKITELTFIPQNNLPSGFIYMGINETATINISNSPMIAPEGVYKFKEGYFRIQVIKNDNPDALFNQYKLRYKDANYNPFQEVFFNGHKATQVTDYTIKNGQVALYSVIWTNDSHMIIVTSEEPTDVQNVINLASATGI